jgi:hypothetical protein
MLLFSFLCLYLLSILSLGRNTLASLTTAHKFLEEVFLEEVAVLRHSLRGLEVFKACATREAGLVISASLSISSLHILPASPTRATSLMPSDAARSLVPA